jgi:hypothetical protein
MPALNGRSVLPDQLWRGSAVMSVSRDIRKVALGRAYICTVEIYLRVDPSEKLGNSIPTPRKMTELLSTCRNRVRWSFTRAIDKRNAAASAAGRRGNISLLKPWR